MASTDGLHLTTVPVTVLVPPSAGAAPASSAKDTVAMLVLEGVEGRSPQPIRINLFIDETDANRRNGTDGPRFLGSIQILPSSGLVRKSGYMFDLSEMVGAGARAFALTLVPVIGVDEEPRDVDLRIGRILIRRKRL